MYNLVYKKTCFKDGMSLKKKKKKMCVKDAN